MGVPSTAVTTSIHVLHPPCSPDASDVQERIARALLANGAAEADQLRISTSAGKIAITGRVRSWAEQDDAIAAARATPGVTELEDNITLAP